MTRLPKRYFKSISDYVKTYYTAYGAQRAQKLYDAVKTVTEDFTRTDPVYVRIGDDGEPEIHYTVATAKSGSFYFRDMNFGNAKLIFRNFNKFNDITYIFNHSVCKTVEIDSIGATDMTAFNMCHWASRDGVQNINAFDTSKVTSWNSAFYWNRGIKEIPAFDMSAATDLYHVFYEASNITAIHCAGMKVSLDLSYCTKMSRDALLEVFNNLADLTGKTSATLTIGSTLGAKITDEDRAIVTNKNWILTE